MPIRDLVPSRGLRRPSALRRNLAEPFSRLHDEMDRLFDEFWPRFSAPSGGDGRTLTMPAVDVSETDDALDVTADLPGLVEKDIDVKLSNGALVISGERKEETEERKKNYYYAERYYGSFSRSVPLPCEIDESGIDAKFKNGVLTVHLPKSEKAKEKERKIEIKPAQ